MPLSFTTDSSQEAASAIDGAEPIEFTLDDETFKAYPPTPAQFAYHVREQSHRDTSRRIASVINFLDGLLDEQGRDRFAERLLDRDDPFGLDDVNNIIAGLIEEWTANPTEPPSSSAQSPSTAGKRSTAKRRTVESVS